MGRSNMPSTKKKRENINFCTTTTQKKELEKRAIVEDISLGKYIRNILFPK